MTSFVRKSPIRNPSEEIVRPQLTSIIDMMVFLLIFILKTFSTESSVITPSTDLTLPASLSKQKPVAALMIEVTRSQIIVEGQVVASLSDVEQSKELVIPKLLSVLRQKVTNEGGTAKTREVIVQCDKRTDFKYVKRVLGTCSQASYSDFSLLVLQKD